MLESSRQSNTARREKIAEIKGTFVKSSGFKFAAATFVRVLGMSLATYLGRRKLQSFSPHVISIIEHSEIVQAVFVLHVLYTAADYSPSNALLCARETKTPQTS